MVQSKALEANIADYAVDVTIEARYLVLQEIMSRYYGIMDAFNTFLTELSHPYRNWRFILQEARTYSLDYFHLMRAHPRGGEAAALYVKIFTDAIGARNASDIKADAADNLLLFLQKIIKEAGENLPIFMPVIATCFDQIRASSNEAFALFVQSFYQINRLAEGLVGADGVSERGYRSAALLLKRYLSYTYEYWLAEKDPGAWFQAELAEDHTCPEGIEDIFAQVSHAHILTLQRRLDQIGVDGEKEAVEPLRRLLELPGYNQIVQAYRQVPLGLAGAGRDGGRRSYWKMIFLFFIMNVSGLSSIHEEALRDINRTISAIIANEKTYHVDRLLEKTFSILKEHAAQFPATALACVVNMGRGVYRTDDSELVNYFIESVIDLGFQAPRIRGVGNDWQVQVNPAHIQNIRAWLELIERSPAWSVRLMSYLTIHLSLCGVFIKDTDLFPRDITRLLNSDIAPVFNLAKQLTKLFPTYFNDIGAEGRLRDTSTRLDELTRRRDALVHFMRKQSHVESSNRIIDFMEAALAFWRTREKRRLEPYVPPDIYRQIEPAGPYVDGVSRAAAHLVSRGLRWPVDLLKIDLQKLTAELETAEGVDELDRERIVLVAEFYQLLYQKYNFEFTALGPMLARLKAEGFPHVQGLEDALAESDSKRRLSMLLEYLERLKALILSPESFEIREDIYKKRHITVDIPSMYGSYHEMKFDALGLTLRIESLVNVLFDTLIDKIDLSLITKATFFRIHDMLVLFNRALKVNGISSKEIEMQLDFLAHSLEARGFTFTQYLDIFKGFALAVRNIINDYFHNIHEANLSRILRQISPDQLLAKYLPSHAETLAESDKLRHRISEVFFREKIALSLGLQQLDRFLSRILQTLFNQADKLPKDKLRLLLNYDAKRAMTNIEPSNPLVSGIVYLGNKGYNVVRLRSFGYPVPPGLIISTEVFRSREIVENYPPAEQNFKEQIGRQIATIEQSTGQQFGNPENPLLFSVRSGSSISQPGMMDTFLNVGINEEITTGFARRTGNPWFAWDNYRRFLQCYGMSWGMERDDFDAVIDDFKQRLGIPLKKEFTGDQMREVALAYMEIIVAAGIRIPSDPFQQLHTTIRGVFDSWFSPKAKTYRRIMGISHDWGTAVTIQAMVYGNMSSDSGSGVVFTHNPRWSGETLRLWGDFTLGNQGEDVVSGLVNTLPISLTQQEIEMRDTDITLETHYPEIYKALKNWASDLIYNRGWSPQEVEFTFEGPSSDKLYLLQARDMGMRERKQALGFDPAEMAATRILGHGIGVSGGAMSGRVVFSLEEIDHWREKEPQTSLVLTRSDTVPDDIKEIFAADGLLTARGGLTSHAAVVAHRLGKTCVAGCNDLDCNERQKTAQFGRIRLASGDPISIDGHSGSVYQGWMKVGEA